MTVSKGREHAERRKAQAAAARPHRNRKRYYRPAEGRIEDYVTMADVWYASPKGSPAHVFVGDIPFHTAMKVAEALYLEFFLDAWVEEV